MLSEQKCWDRAVFDSDFKVKAWLRRTGKSTFDTPIYEDLKSSEIFNVEVMYDEIMYSSLVTSGLVRPRPWWRRVLGIA